MLYHYNIAGLNFALPFPATACYATVSQPDVTVRYGMVPTCLPKPISSGRHFQACPETLLFMADGCRFLVHQGQEVLCEIEGHVAPELLTMHLTQSVLGAVLFQRGWLPLHASAVQVHNGQGIALLGRSGIGKSTLAAYLYKHNFPVITDDLCPISCQPEPVITGGVPYLKLSDGVIQQLAMQALPFYTADRARRRVALSQDAPRSARLHRLYVLVPQAGVTAPQFRRLTPREAMQALLDNTYRGQYVRGLGLQTWQFTVCAHIAATTPLVEVRYERALSLLPQLVEEIAYDCTTG